MDLSSASGTQSVVLDYKGAGGTPEILRNLSGLAAEGGTLWTVSDEGRTLERLEAVEGGYLLAEQLRLDALFPDLPVGKEADLESVDVAGGRVWVCGSHGRVREKRRPPDRAAAGVRRRPSRHLLGSVPLDGARQPRALPFLGASSLRRRLRDDPFLSVFMNVPSKENGFDVEGVTVRGNRLLLGLRGPVIDGLAIVLELGLEKNGSIADRAPLRHFLKLGGLGIRDLARWDDDVLVLAGPNGAADGPFRLHRWRPAETPASQAVRHLHSWPLGPEHPEGICRLAWDGRDGLLVVFDSQDDRRIDGTRYWADWLEIPTTD